MPNMRYVHIDLNVFYIYIYIYIYNVLEGIPCYYNTVYGIYIYCILF